MDLSALQLAVLLFGVSCIGALLPLYRRWSERGLHAFVALAAGIFLGTIFLHLLPHLAGVELDDGHGHGHSHGPAAAAGHPLVPWIAALAGLLLLFAIERVWIPSWHRDSAPDPHTGLWAATFVGLSLHALTAGVALPALLSQPSALTLSILIHKATETFSLATVMRLAHVPRGRMIVLLLLFAAIEPASLLAGSGLLGLGAGVEPVLTGFACGTFLYVAVCDLLPEVFHGGDRPALKLLCVVLGIGLTALSLPSASVLFGFLERTLLASTDIFVELAPMLLVGFVIAGVIGQVLRIESLTKRLRGNDLKSVALASLIGAPLPLCSCAVLPVAVSMRRAGASKGATSAFLIATPETGVDSVTVTWALLDPVMTIARPIGAIVSSIFTGSCVNWLVRRGWDREPAPAPLAQAHAEAPGDASCCHTQPAPRAPVDVAGSVQSHADTHEHAGTHAHERAHDAPASHVHAAASRAPWLVRVLRYAFVDLLDDLAVSLLVGVVVSGAIAVLVPDAVFASPAAHGFTGMLLMLVIGIPIYVCAAASTPIAATLILKGMSPGAAFVFLLASPATNLGSLIALRKHLGTRVVLVHVAGLAVVTLMLGFAIDGVYAWLDIAPSASGAGTHEHTGIWHLGAAYVLAGLLLVSFLRTHGPRDLLARWRAGTEPAAR